MYTAIGTDSTRGKTGHRAPQFWLVLLAALVAFVALGSSAHAQGVGSTPSTTAPGSLPPGGRVIKFGNEDKIPATESTNIATGEKGTFGGGSTAPTTSTNSPGGVSQEDGNSVIEITMESKRIAFFVNGVPVKSGTRLVLKKDRKVEVRAQHVGPRRETIRQTRLGAIESSDYQATYKNLLDHTVQWVVQEERYDWGHAAVRSGAPPGVKTDMPNNPPKYMKLVNNVTAFSFDTSATNEARLFVTGTTKWYYSSEVAPGKRTGAEVHDAPESGEIIIRLMPRR